MTIPSSATILPFPLGGFVYVAEGQIRALITAITAYPNGRFRVCCAWWSYGKRNEEWFEECEITSKPLVRYGYRGPC